MTQALSLSEAARWLGKPEAVLLAIARGYTRKGQPPRPDPVGFTVERRRLICRFDRRYAVMTLEALRADGRSILVTQHSEGLFDSADEAAAALASLEAKETDG